MLREEDVDSNTPLLMGIESGNVDIVSHLVEAGGDVNQCNRNRVYPLHLACTNGSLEIVKLLLHVSWRRKTECKTLYFWEISFKYPNMIKQWSYFDLVAKNAPVSASYSHCVSAKQFVME